MPDDIAARMSPEGWEEDWRVMSLPGRLDLQRSLIRDHARHVDRFAEIAAYLEARQPPALLLWGRHDPFFELDETRSWMEALPRLEAHIPAAPIRCGAGLLIRLRCGGGHGRHPRVPRR